MASPAPARLPDQTVRERVARAVCSRHGDGKNAPVCELGQTVTDVALAEVRVWLLEIADRAEYGGVMRLLASMVGDGIPGLEDGDG